MTKHILIVEDSLTQAVELKALLLEHGYRVTAAINGEEGLAMAREFKPDLIITDVVMPVMDGYEMCQAIKRDESLRNTPVIVLTVLVDPEDVIRALKAGVDYYLTKPYEENHLLSRVASSLAEPVLRESERVRRDLEVVFGSVRHVITSDRQQILNLLLSTYDNAVQQNRELIRTQRALQRLNEQLEDKIVALEELQDKLIRTERLATIGQLGASVGHELRHPLGVISNSVYYLNMRLEGSEDKVKKHLKIIEREIAATNKIVSDLLSFARGREPSLQKTQINNIIQDALSRATVPDRVAVVTELAEGLPSLMCDPGQIEQVFINMILNAVQAMTSSSLRAEPQAEGSVETTDEGWLEIATSKEEGFIVTEFTDTGCGISEENMKKLFEPLFTTKAKGIGLGLAVSKRIIEAHGGSIEVESPFARSGRNQTGEVTGEMGKGTTFRIKLPILIS